MHSARRHFSSNRSPLSSVELSSTSTSLATTPRRSPRGTSGQSPPPRFFRHVVLLPEWVDDFRGASEAEMYFKLEPIARLIAQLVDLNACCIVLDWEMKPMLAEEERTELPYHLRYHRLGQKALFVIDPIRHGDFLKQANWRRVIAVAQAHYALTESNGLAKLHIHDAAKYLRRDNFNFRKHRIDGLLLPDCRCRNLCTDRAVRCMPSEKEIEALHHYLQMLHDTIRPERIAELRQRRQARQQVMRDYRRSEMEPVPVVESVRVGCGPCKRQQQRIRMMSRGALFSEAERRGRGRVQKPRRPKNVLSAFKGLEAAAADFADATINRSPAA